jgi:uncharacterized protein
MKYLLILALVVAVYMWWRHARIADAQARQRPPAPKPGAGGAQDMVCCPVCSVHLPRGDALAGPDGRLYCSQEHRLRAPGG